MKALIIATLAFFLAAQTSIAGNAVLVSVDNFNRAESDRYFQHKVDDGMFGKFVHVRTPVPVDDQPVVRVNRDTLFSWGIFDLIEPVTVIKPDTGDRFQSMLVINEDHYVKLVAYGPGEYELTQEMIGTRYVQVAFRTLVNSSDPADVRIANAIQDEIGVRQSSIGEFVIPDWDEASLNKVRKALAVLASTMTSSERIFGDVDEVDPIRHLIGTAVGFGGAPESDAMYLSRIAPDNDGETPYTLTVKDVPVDGFWSVSVYNKEGYFQENEYNAYSTNNLTASKEKDGSVVIRFGGDPKQSNYLAIMPGWNYTIRMYRPRSEILDGSWTFPNAKEITQ